MARLSDAFVALPGGWGTFEEIFEVILGLGEVSQKSIETHDVTEFFRDLKIRSNMNSPSKISPRVSSIGEYLSIDPVLARLGNDNFRFGFPR